MSNSHFVGQVTLGTLIGQLPHATTIMEQNVSAWGENKNKRALRKQVLDQTMPLWTFGYIKRNSRTKSSTMKSTMLFLFILEKLLTMYHGVHFGIEQWKLVCHQSLKLLGFFISQKIRVVTFQLASSLHNYMSKLVANKNLSMDSQDTLTWGLSKDLHNQVVAKIHACGSVERNHRGL